MALEAFLWMKINQLRLLIHLIFPIWLNQQQQDKDETYKNYKELLLFHGHLSALLPYLIRKEKEGSYQAGKDHLLVNSKGESYISYADYAIAVLDEIENPKHLNERFTVVGKQNKYLKKKKIKNAISVNANGILLSGYRIAERST